MIKHKQEFEIGDEVTFDSYGKPLRAMVTEVTNFDIWGNDTGRVWYKLLGFDIATKTTGESIRESQYFKPWTKQEAVTFFKG